MLPLKDCRGYRSRYINALNRAVRALTPIAGRGIRLRQSAQGVVIESTAKGGGAKASPFRHRWQVTATSEVQGTSTVWTLHVAPGSVWERAEDGALQEAEITPEAPVLADEEAGGWKITPAASGALYVAQNADGAKVLRLGSAEDETDTVLLRVADVTVTTATPPACIVEQRQVGDFVLAAEGEFEDVPEIPAAWMVRKNAYAETTSSGEVTTYKWQVFSPLWCVGRDTLLPANTSRGWNDLATTSGTLYAALTWTGVITRGEDGEETTTWTQGVPIITNSIADVPQDKDPEPPSRYGIPGEPGSRSVIVEIGTFIGTGDDLAFRQAHVGVIVEALADTFASGGGLPDGTTIWGKVSIEEQTNGSSSSGDEVTGYKILQTKQAWSTEKKAFEDAGDPVEIGTIEVASGGGQAGPVYVPGPPEVVFENEQLLERSYFHTVAVSAEGVPSLVRTNYVAWEREAAYHADDHTEGIL